MNEITSDVNKITGEMKAEIAAKDDLETIPSFGQVIFGDPASAAAELASLRREIDSLREREIHFFREIDSRHKALTPVVVFIKRVIRKLDRFMIEPIVSEINNYHIHVIRALDHTLNLLEQLNADADKTGQGMNIPKRQEEKERDI